MSKTKSNIVPGSTVAPGSYFVVGADAEIVPAFGSLTASRDAVTIQNVIKEQYGFTPTLEYCAALIDFVEALTDGQRSY
jgi:hypothetical protein